MLVITSDFGPRIHPIKNVPDQHNGIDIGAPEGTPVQAVQQSIIQEFRDNDPVMGHALKLLVITGPFAGWSFWYMHLKTVRTQIKGFPVKKGEIIGTVGKTGSATGPHLHFAAYDTRGRAIDPVTLYPPGTFVKRGNV